jgi:Leucine-rich repeat (LRR) protein
MDDNEKRDDKYIVYKNDLKYKINRELDESKIKWSSPEVKNMYHTIDLDTVQYRIDECIEEKYITLDLKHLNLDKLPILPNKIIKSVKYLFLGDNKFTQFPDLTEWTNLEMLEFNHNKVKEINNLPKSLIELCCKDNLLEDIQFNNNNKIERLDIRQNKLKNINIPLSIKILDIAQNEIYICINKLPNIEKILCANNQIKEIINCPLLTYLDCRSNPVININNCNKIEHLVCSNTLLNKIPECPNIRTIECFYTKICELPYFEQLYELMCENNQIKKISSKYNVVSAETYKEKLLHIIFKIN